MDLNKIYKLIKTIESDLQFRFVAYFYEKNINLILLENQNTWVGNFDGHELNKQAKVLKISSRDYLNKLKIYLKGDPGDSKIIYSFQDGSFTLFCEVEGKRIKFFTCILCKEHFSEVVGTILDEIFLENDNLSKRLIDLKRENTNIIKEKFESEQKLIEFVNRKQKDDENLFKKFTLILNEKKIQIQHLNELLDAFKQGRPATNYHLLPDNRKKIKKEDIKQEDPSTDEEEIKSNSSFESDIEITTMKSDSTLCEEINKPSTSKAVTNRNTLFNSDDEEDKSLNVQATVPKRIKSAINLISPEKLGKMSSDKVDISKNDKESINENNSPNETITLNTQDLIDII